MTGWAGFLSTRARSFCLVEPDVATWDHQPGAAKCSCLNPERRRPGPSDPRAARCWSHRLRRGAAGSDPQSSTESIAGREGCSVRKVNKTISLAFLAPDLVRRSWGIRLKFAVTFS